MNLFSIVLLLSGTNTVSSPEELSGSEVSAFEDKLDASLIVTNHLLSEYALFVLLVDVPESTLRYCELLVPVMCSIQYMHMHTE